MRKIGLVLCIVAMVGVAVLAYRRPVPTFDRLIYATAVAHLHTSDEAVIVHEAFRLSPAGDYPHTAFSDELMRKPALLVQQARMYSSRLLYLYALDLFGMRVVSPVAYLGIGAILLCWLRNPWWCLALVLAPDMIYVCRSITPDALSALVVLGALFFVSIQRELIGLSLLFVSLAVRTDNLLFLAGVVLVMVLRRRIAWYWALAALLGAMSVVLGIQHYTHDYGGFDWTWRMRILIDANVATPMFLAPGSVALPRITPKEYVTGLVHGLIGTTTIGFSLWVLIGAITWRIYPKSRDWLFVAGFYAATHILIFPMPEPRYFVASFLLVWISFACAINSSPQQASDTW